MRCPGLLIAVVVLVTGSGCSGPGSTPSRAKGPRPAPRAARPPRPVDRPRPEPRVVPDCMATLAGKWETKGWKLVFKGKTGKLTGYYEVKGKALKDFEAHRTEYEYKSCKRTTDGLECANTQTFYVHYFDFIASTDGDPGPNGMLRKGCDHCVNGVGQKCELTLREPAQTPFRCGPLIVKTRCAGVVRSIRVLMVDAHTGKQRNILLKRAAGKNAKR